MLKQQAIIFIFSLFLVQNLAYALDGWDKKITENTIVYTPVMLSNNKIFELTVYSAEGQENQRLKTWFKNKVPKLQSKLGKPLKEWSYQTKNNTIQTFNSYKHPKLGKVAVSYISIPLKQDERALARVISSYDKEVVNNYVSQIDKILKDAKPWLVNNKSTSIKPEVVTEKNQKPNKPKKTVAISVNTKKIATDFKAIWSLNTWSYRPTSGMWGVNETIVAAFNDGTMTSNLSSMFAEKRDAFKSASWGYWKKNNGKIIFKWHGDKKYKKTKYKVETTPGNTNQTLTGCYKLFKIYSDDSISAEGFSFAGFKHWCFDKQGRFIQSSKAVSSIPTVVAKSSNNKSGTYRIDGYAISLNYDGGRILNTGFAFLNDTTITINGSRFSKK